MFFKKTSGAAAPGTEKPKFRIRKRHLKRAAVIALYSFVVLATIIGMVAPGLQF